MMKTITGLFIFLVSMTHMSCGTNKIQVSTFVSGLDEPYGIAQDVLGNFYVAERKLGSILKITPDGVVSTYAIGRFEEPVGVAIDPSGNLYVADRGNGSIKKITAGGTVSTLAKGFCAPHDLKLDEAGNIYVVDGECPALYKISPGGVKKILAGDGKGGNEDGAVTQARFENPHGIAVDPQGMNVYVGDSANGRVRKITGGQVSTLASNLRNPQNLTVDGSGNVYVSEVGKGLEKITPAGEVSLVTSRCLSPRGVCQGPGGTLYVADKGSPRGSNVILKIQMPK